MYAIIETGGKQYKVQAGDVVFIEKLDVEPEQEITFDKVMVVGKDDGKRFAAHQWFGAQHGVTQAQRAGLAHK